MPALEWPQSLLCVNAHYLSALVILDYFSVLLSAEWQLSATVTSPKHQFRTRACTRSSAGCLLFAASSKGVDCAAGVCAVLVRLY